MHDCWSFTCCLSGTLGSSLKCSQLKSLLWYYFGRCSFEMAQLVPLSYSWGRSTPYSDRLDDFSVTIAMMLPFYSKDVYVNRFFPCKARTWNSLPTECFPLTYDINTCKSRINRHLDKIYSSSDTECDRLKLVIMDPFLSFYLCPEFWKNKKNCWRYHFTHVYQKPQSYDVRFLRYRVRLTFWAIFCPFIPLTTWKIKILKK